MAKPIIQTPPLTGPDAEAVRDEIAHVASAKEIKNRFDSGQKWLAELSRGKAY